MTLNKDLSVEDHTDTQLKTFVEVPERTENNGILPGRSTILHCSKTVNELTKALDRVVVKVAYYAWTSKRYTTAYIINK